MSDSESVKKQTVLPISTVPTKNSRGGPFLNFLIQFLVVAVIFFAVGYALGQKKIEILQKGTAPQINVVNKYAPETQNVDFALFWSVFETLPQKFLDKSAIDSQKLLYGAISGMVRSLGDPYTAFLDPKQNEAIKSELAGSYEGVGIQIGFNREKRLVVIAPLKGTPAAAVGLAPRDLILKIDKRETFDLSLPEAVDLIRGPAGSRVKLVLQHENADKTFEVEIERAKIDVKSVEIDFVDGRGGQVAIIKVSRFGDKTDSEWDSAVSQILQKGVRGVVVDMRNNPGGLLSSSVHLASEFIKGTVVKQEFADGSLGSIAVDHTGKLLTLPVAVLVNGGSASASEIFAGAIQDGRRGKIVGEKTFGKGTVQDVVDFAGGSGLHVTIAKWLTPKGTSINGTGITPDVIIEQTQEDIDADFDPQLDQALELVQ
jgi:carboxyl-terminal processing protease